MPSSPRQPASPPGSLNLRRLPLLKIKPAPYNPRVDLKPGDPIYEQLRHSIETFGVVEPIVWNKRTGHVVGGHQRLAVLQALGHSHADVVTVNLTPQREKALNLALNKIVGAWDENKLADLLENLSRDPSFDLSLTGFQTSDVDALLAGLGRGQALEGNDADFDAVAALDTSRPAVTKPGELLILGEHRLLCGDSTNADDVKRLMNGSRAILFATDPPYLVGYDGTNHPGKKAGRGRRAADSGPTPWERPPRKSRSTTTKNKDWSGTYGISWDDADGQSDLYDRFIGTAVAEALEPNAAWYCWHASRRQAMVEVAWQKHGAFVHCQIVWAKNRPVLTRTWYAWQHEPCFFGWRQGHKPPRGDSPMRSTLWSIDTIPNGPERPDHPTPKPLEIFEIPIGQHTKPRDICYEPFAGSGTQIIAAEKLGRRCFAMEISPHYCDVIVRRWIHLVGAARAGRALAKRYALTASTSALKGGAR
jgi:DNA modification methylase